MYIPNKVYDSGTKGPDTVCMLLSDYKFLGIMKRQFPGVPILGLTATATSAVFEDVKKILNIEHCTVFKASFNRPNLYYEVITLKMVKLKYHLDGGHLKCLEVS